MKGLKYKKIESYHYIITLYIGEALKDLRRKIIGGKKIN